MKKLLKSIIDWIAFIFTGKGDIAVDGVDSGYLDFSGQGRDKYGN